MSKSFIGNSSLPLGLRNNNPGNIRTSIIPWVGQTGSNSGFCTFKDVSYGLRAMAIDLSNKISKDKLDTITEIITKYAPPSENDTASYINKVASITGWNANQLITFNSANIANLMRAQIEVEQGSNFSSLITDADISDGISMIPQSITNRVKSFFVDNPALATASTIGVLAVIVVILLALFKPNSLKIKK